MVKMKLKINQLDTETRDWTEEVYLQPGEMVSIEVRVKYLHLWPAVEVRDVEIDQTWPVDADFDRGSIDQPYFAPGTFNLEKFSYRLAEDGKGYVLEFEVPDKPTTLRANLHVWQYMPRWHRKQMKQRMYTILVLPMTKTFEAAYDELPLPEAPVNPPG